MFTLEMHYIILIQDIISSMGGILTSTGFKVKMIIMKMFLDDDGQW